jgi:uncharacterized membrane protein
MPQNLVVVGFDEMHRAADALHKLRHLDASWGADLQDAVAAYRTDDGRLRIDQSVASTRREGATTGALVGVILGAIAASPFTGGMSAIAAGAALGASAASGGMAGREVGAASAADWKSAYGISDEFVNEVGKLIQPGHSALFAILRTLSPDLVAERFRGYGGTILRTTLSPRQAERVQRTLRG